MADVDEDVMGIDDAGDADLQLDDDSGKNLALDGQEDGSQDAAGQDEVAGLKAAAAAERQKRQTAEADAQALRDQIAIQAAARQAPSQQQADIYKQLGIDVEDDDDPVDAGFAALRAQSAQRKDRIQRLKDNVASNLEMCRKIGETSKMLRLDPQSLDARRVEPSVDDACALSVPAVHEGLPNPVTRRA